jgi:hypothetical protein
MRHSVPQAVIDRYQAVFPKHTLNEKQLRFFASRDRFAIVPAGRRSGKTAIAKHKMLRRALLGPTDGKYLVGAPTNQQAKRIFWRDLKKMTLGLRRSVSEVDATIFLHTGASITVAGLDAPERFEGVAWDGALIDEMADVRASAWYENLFPALNDVSRPRPGWAIIVGVPGGRGAYYDLWQAAQSDPMWCALTWPSSDVLPESMLAVARAQLDPRTYRQEFEASFETFGGRIYYAFDAERHVEPVTYDGNLDLDLSFDFNVAPGVAVVSQEQPYRGTRPNRGQTVTAVLGEVHIPQDSTTPRVVDAILAAWAERHRPPKRVRLFGDATGGASGSAKVAGSDWDLIKRQLRTVYQPQHIVSMVPRANPPERARVNSMNARLEAADGTVSMVVDPGCKHLIRDLEGVTAVDGSAGAIDKKSDPRLTHISDALGYLVHRIHPLDARAIAYHYGT